MGNDERAFGKAGADRSREAAVKGRGRKGAARSRGSLLLEVMIAISVFVVSALASAGLLTSCFSLLRVNRESGIALAAARDAIEALQDGDPQFKNLFYVFNGDPNDDPGGPGTSPGSHFAVRGLTARAGDPDGLPGRIEFPGTSGSPGVLREDLTANLFGLTATVDRNGDAVLDTLDACADLNGDGVIDSDSHHDDYILLPVIVRIEWSGASGNRSLVLQTFVAKH